MHAVRARVGALLGGGVTFEELKHKPGRRRTLRARARSGTAIVKVYASERAPVVAARVGALAADGAEPRVPRVLLVDPGLHLVVLSEVDGRPLRAALLEADLGACRRAGAALGAWHRRWSGARPLPLREHTPERELEILARHARRAPAGLEGPVRAAAERLGGPWGARGVVHRDLYEEQIMLGDAVGLIDLDDASLGPPELDVANLVAHIELLAMRAGCELEAPTRALLGAYAVAGPRLEPAVLERCRKLTLLRLACIHREAELLAAAERDRFAPAAARRAGAGANA